MGSFRREAFGGTSCDLHVIEQRFGHKYIFFLIHCIYIVYVSSYYSKCGLSCPLFSCLVWPKVLATLVSLLFALPGLPWEKPIKHLETFSGTMEVTKHEWLDRGRVQKRW